jgi:predicted dehydrogenase
MGVARWATQREEELTARLTHSKRGVLGVCLVGCGFMGRRHLRGYAALQRAGLLRAELVALLDLDRCAAEDLAREAERLLGRRPTVYKDLTAVLSDPEVHALDVVTDPRTHHTIAVPALERGCHVLSEKPLALTVRAAQRMIDAASKSGVVLATAENYRRGGANRTARAVIDAGILGELHLMVEHMIGGSDEVQISQWRHLKESGAISLDMGCHLIDIVEYYLGPLAWAFGRGFIAEPIRRDSKSGTMIDATGDDSLIALLRTESGVDVHFAYVPSGRGQSHVRRTLHGRAGSMIVPPDRSDGEVVIHTGEGTLTGPSLRKTLGEHFVLDEVTLALLGPDGSGGRGVPFAAVDAGYIGVEIADFVAAALDGSAPEVDGVGGLRALAGVYAIVESGLQGRPVSIDEVVDGSAHSYQDGIDRTLETIA